MQIKVTDYRDINSTPKQLGMLTFEKLFQILGDEVAVAWDRDVPHLLSEELFADIGPCSLAGYYGGDEVRGVAEIKFGPDWRGFVRCIVDPTGEYRWIIVRDKNGVTHPDFWNWYPKGV